MKKILVFASLLLATYAAQCMSSKVQDPKALKTERTELNQHLMNMVHVSSWNKERFTIIKELLKMGAEIDGGDQFTSTTLGDAIHRNDLEMVKFLIQNHADVNQVTSKLSTIMPFTPLMLAVNYRNKDIILYLLSTEGIDVNKDYYDENFSKTQQTALDMMLRLKKPDPIEKEIAQILRKHGAKTYKELQESEQKS